MATSKKSLVEYCFYDNSTEMEVRTKPYLFCSVKNVKYHVCDSQAEVREGVARVLRVISYSYKTTLVNKILVSVEDCITWMIFNSLIRNLKS